MRAQLRAKAGKAGTPICSPRRVFAVVVAPVETETLIAEHLRHHDVEVHVALRYGTMAAALFDDPEPGQGDRPILFVLDLRVSCGSSVIDARLVDYDAVLNAHMMAGHPWPKTLCLVETEQTHPVWLQTRPHFRATLLADEVETVIGHPQQRDWHKLFAAALSRCLS
jgi:hypothetical protein